MVWVSLYLACVRFERIKQQVYLGSHEDVHVVGHRNARLADPMQLLRRALPARRQLGETLRAPLLVLRDDLANALLDGVLRGVFEDVVVMVPEERGREAHGPTLFVVSRALDILWAVHQRNVGRGD